MTQANDQTRFDYGCVGLETNREDEPLLSFPERLALCPRDGKGILCLGERHWADAAIDERYVHSAVVAKV